VVQLYAVCRQNGQLAVKHVQLTNQVQLQLDEIFQAQETDFLAGVTDEIDFTGDWKPDEDELLVIRGLPECQILLDASNQNAIALPVLDVGNFEAEKRRRLLVQNFGPQQLFSGRFALLHDGNVFRRITEPAFSLGTQLVAVIDEGGEIRFRSYAMLRRILDITPVFRQATDGELQNFCVHPSLGIPDTAAFINNADEVIRKHVLAVTKADVLGQFDVAAIQAQAMAIHFLLGVTNGRIDMPMDRKGTKALLSFLLNKVYQGPLGQQLFITNSNRPLT
jgi:hypothetical protein